MTLIITLNSKIEEELMYEAQRLGMSPVQYSIQAIVQHLTETRSHSETNTLLESWLISDAGEQEDTGEAIVQGLEEERLSTRHLFPPELKGITW